MTHGHSHTMRSRGHLFEPGSEYVGLGHFGDSKFCISILGGGGGGGGVRKMIFLGGMTICLIFFGHHKIGPVSVTDLFQ